MNTGKAIKSHTVDVHFLVNQIEFLPGGKRLAVYKIGESALVMRVGSGKVLFKVKAGEHQWEHQGVVHGTHWMILGEKFGNRHSLKNKLRLYYTDRIIKENHK